MNDIDKTLQPWEAGNLAKTSSVCCWGIEWEVLTSELEFLHLHQGGHPEALYGAVTSYFTVPRFKIGVLTGKVRLQHPEMETDWVGSLWELVYTSGRGPRTPISYVQSFRRLIQSASATLG